MPSLGSNKDLNNNNSINNSFGSTASVPLSEVEGLTLLNHSVAVQQMN